MGTRRRVAVSILFIMTFVSMPVLDLVAGWPAVRATEWGAALSGFFGAIERIGGSGGSIGANWGVFLLWLGLILILVPMDIAGMVKAFDDSGEATRRRSTVEGVVREAELEVFDDTDGTTYKPVITYHFIVEGKKYTHVGDITNWWSNDKEGQEKIVSKYPPGAKITVFYEPDNCDNNSLMKWAPSNKFWLVIDVSLLLIGYCVCTLAVGIFLTLYIKSFIGNPLSLQVISIVIFAVIVVSFVLFSRYYFKKALGGPKPTR
ncbi:MAG: DUF3592 domain-containing protein [Candidatus Lokiarchaeota archaeon]|nr:DUF3592 domain-containing protein [Candidatus Lokiarchaeota archaeon]